MLIALSVYILRSYSVVLLSSLTAMTNPKKPKRQYGTLEGWGALLGGIAAIATLIVTVMDNRQSRESQVTTQEPPASEIIEDSPSTDESDELEDSDTAEEAPPLSSAPELPLLLENNRNTASSANTTSGDTTLSPAIPSILPGKSESYVRDQLGSPTKETEEDRFYTAIFDLVPNTTSLAYIYDTDSERVIQSEATFSSDTPQLFLKIFFYRLFELQVTNEVREGFEAVAASQRDRFSFENEELSGFIRRNQSGDFYIVIREEG